MNHSVNTTPSLLTLTAPSREPVRPESASPAFAEELSAAAAPSRDPQDETGEEITAAEEPEADPQADQQGAVEEKPSEDAEVTPDEVIDSDLLAVAVVTETIVAETSPQATLPEHAATTVSVGLEVESTLPTEASSTSEATTSTQVAGALVDSEEPLVDPLAEAVEPQAEVEAAAELTNNEPAKSSSQAQEGDSPIVAEAKPETTDAKASPIESPTTTSAQIEEAVAPIEQASQESTEKRGSQPDIENQPSGSTPPAAQEGSTEKTGADVASNSDAAPSRETSSAPATLSVEALKERAEAVRTEATDSRPTVDPARFVSRVSRAIETAHERGGGPIEIRLSPPELGSLRVQIEMKEGVLSASLEAETPAARNTLLDNLPALRERLEQQQIRLEKFDVDVRDDSQQRGGGGAPEGDTQRRPDDSPDRREPTAERRAEREGPTPEPERAVATITFDDDGLNLVV